MADVGLEVSLIALPQPHLLAGLGLWVKGGGERERARERGDKAQTVVAGEGGGCVPSGRGGGVLLALT